MDRKFVVDKEINLNDYDFLETKIYAKSLTEIIKNTEKNKVFTVGLFGSWGTGKSSIVKTSQNDFNENKVKFVIYDAWQYCNDSFRRMFLRKLKDELKYESTDLMRKFYENESVDVGYKYKLSSTRLCFIIAGLILLLLFFNTIPLDPDFKFTAYSTVTLLGLLIGIISGAFHQLKIGVIKPHFFAPEQFEDCFSEIASYSLKDINCIDRVARWVIGNNAIRNLEKLVIVIDNIDRCSNDVAYNLLTDIKTFLTSKDHNIVFVIPVDDEALRKHIISENKESDNNKDKEEFLRKFFNAVIRIKPYGETDMFAFAKKISERAGLNLKNETINLAAKEYSKNPRRVIQLFNNLLVEFTLYENYDFVQENETLICAILILREEFDTYYKKVIDSPKMLIDWKPQDEKTASMAEFNRFVRIIHNTIDTIELPVLNQILTNSSSFFTSEIKDAIDTYNIKILIDIFVENRNLIIDYVINQMEFAVKNDLIKKELTGLFEIICELNKVFPLEKQENKRILEKSDGSFEIIITNCKLYNELCIYSINLKNQGFSLLQNTIISMVLDKPEEKGNYWKLLFNAIIRNLQDKITSEKLNNLFTAQYQLVDESIELSPAQWEYLISNEFVQQRIIALSEINQDEEDFEMVKSIFENKKNVSVDTYGAFFIKTVELVGEIRGKTYEELTNILKFTNSIIGLIPNGKLTEEPKALLELIINDRNIPHPSYPNTPQHDSKLNFITESLDKQINISDLITFAIDIYRVTNNKTATDILIKKIMEKNRKEINEKLIIMINQGFTLSPILKLIFQDNDYENINTIVLLKHCFNSKDNKNKYCLTDEDVTKKLDEIFDYAFENKTGTAFELLESLLEQQRYKDILTDLIVNKESTIINDLPVIFLELALNSFNEGNYNDYCDNFDFLFVLASRGSISQKMLVLKLLIEKIDNKNDVDKVINIIELIDNIYEVDPDGLLSTHLSKYKRENKESLSDESKKQLEKILKKLRAEAKSDEKNNE